MIFDSGEVAAVIKLLHLHFQQLILFKLQLFLWKNMFFLVVFLGWLPQHLVQWDAGNSECLLQLVKELIHQYHNYQCERLRESSRLLFEYDSLLEDPNYGRNMEVYAGKKNSWVSDCFNTPWPNISILYASQTPFHQKKVIITINKLSVFCNSWIQVSIYWNI